MRCLQSVLQQVCCKPWMILLFSLLVVACSKNPSSDQTEARHLKAAQGYYQQGQFRPAVLETQTALTANPHSLPAFSLLASIYNTIGAYRENSLFIEARIAGNPALAAPLIEAYFYRGKLVSILRKSESLDETLLLGEEFVNANKFIALAALQLDNLPVLAAAKSRLAANNRDQELLFIEAFKQTLDGNLDQAAASLDQLLQQSLSFDAVKLRALIYLRDNKLGEAEHIISQYLLTLPPTDVSTAQRMQLLQLMVDVLIGQARTGEALVYQRMLAEANPDSYFASQELKRISQLINAGDVGAAQAQLQLLSEKLPQNLQIREFKALLDYQLGNQDEVLNILAGGIDLESASSAFIQLSAKAQVTMQNTESALELLSGAADLQPNNAIILASLGLAELAQNPQSAAALARIEKSLALNPNQPRLHLAVANFYQATGDAAKFAQSLTLAYAADPNDNVIALQYYQHLLATGKVAALNAEFEREMAAAAAASDEARIQRIYFFKGWFALQDGKLSIAQDHLTKAQGNKNLAVAIVYAQAEIFKQSQNYADAIKVLENGLRAHPQSQWLYSQWYALVNQQITPARAQAFLQDLIKGDQPAAATDSDRGDNWMAVTLLGEIFLNQNNVDEALAQFEVALKINPNANLVKVKLAGLYELLADVAAAKSEADKAQSLYLKAIAITPKNIAVLIKLVTVQTAQGQFDQAKLVADGYLQGDDRFVGHYLHAMIAFSQDDSAKGLKELRLSWSENPTDLVGDAIALYFIARNEWALAQDFLAQWMKLIPSSERAYLYAAQLASQSSNVQLSMEYYQKVLQINPQSRIALNNMALLLADDDLARAFDYVERALALGASSAQVLDTQGQLLIKAGRFDEAVKSFEKALGATPNNAQIQQHLEQARAALAAKAQ